MRLEKLNENQIRWTLMKEDLLERQIKLSELAYGSAKTRALFRDMMQIAATELDFQVDNTPLMIEAIPLPSECIILLITKVDDPEELDTRFAKFAPGGNAVPDLDVIPTSLPEGADNVLDMFRKLLDRQIVESTGTVSDSASTAESTVTASGASGSAGPANTKAAADSSGTAVSGSSAKTAASVTGSASAHSSTGTAAQPDMTRLYYFPDLDTVIDAAHVLGGYYNGFNTLYRMTGRGDYCLLIKKSRHTPEEFNKISNILSEYADNEKYTNACEAWLDEHEEVILKEKALQRLSQL